MNSPEDHNKPRPNGLKCPGCGSELLDSSPDLVLCCYPPKKNIHCPECFYEDFRTLDFNYWP